MREKGDDVKRSSKETFTTTPTVISKIGRLLTFWTVSKRILIGTRNIWNVKERKVYKETFEGDIHPDPELEQRRK